MTDFAAVLGDWSVGPGRLHHKLAEALATAITTGALRPDARLPSERALARRLSVSRSTVVAAYSQLVADGLAEARQGSGTYVARRAEAVRARVEVPTPATPIFRRMLADNAGSSELVSFATATVPPTPLLGEVMEQVWREDLAGLCAGSGYQPLGVPALRQAIADEMTRVGLRTGRAQVLATTGAHQALSLCAATLVRPGDRVVIEDPAYPGCIDPFAGAGARFVGIDVDAEGMQVDRLPGVIEHHSPVAICVTPTFHNPTGTALAEHRRRQLADIATRYGVPVIEDHALMYLRLQAGAAPPPVACYGGEGGPFITIGSASKIFWSGLRTGWLRAPEPWLGRIARRKVASDLGSAVFDQAVTARLLGRLDEVQFTLTRTLRDRLAACEEALRSRLEGWTWSPPAGGPSLWVRLPYGDAGSFAQVALRHGVEVIPGSVFSATGRHADRVRIPFTIDPALVEPAFDRLGRAWQAYQPARDDRSTYRDPALVI